MNNFQRISSGADFTAIINAYKRHPEWWEQDTYLRDYPGGPFSQTHQLVLRLPEPGGDPHESVNKPHWGLLPEAHDFIFNLMRYMKATRLGRVYINKMEPGTQIAAHADTPEHANYWDRFHFALESAPGVTFRCGDEFTYMAPGEIWWFQNKIEHHLANRSETARVHMIVDLRLS